MILMERSVFVRLDTPANVAIRLSITAPLTHVNRLKLLPRVRRACSDTRATVRLDLRVTFAKQTLTNAHPTRARVERHAWTA